MNCEVAEPPYVVSKQNIFSLFASSDLRTMAHQAVDTDTDPLCAYCSSLFSFDWMPGWMDSKSAGERTWETIEESAPHCILCYQTTTLHSFRSDTAAAKKLETSSELHWHGNIYVSIYFKTQRFNDWPDGCLAIYESQPGPRQYLPRSEQSDTQPCLNHLTQCLRECLSQHDECVPDDRTDWLPTRLLDVYPNSQKSDSIRLVDRDTVDLAEDNETNKQYLTLSHVWGNADGYTQKLTRSNYASMKEHIDILSLPLCFRDAVLLTRQLRKRYLWIDSLCIIQDSKSDWAREASNMGKVFRNSTCTIAATESQSSNESMIVKDDPRSVQPIWTTLRVGDHINNINLKLDWKFIVRDKSPLFKRGWVTQETWLSPRIIYMCEYPFLECGEGRSPNVWAQVNDLSSRKDINAAFQPDSALDCWYRLVTEYSKTSVTYSSDRLIAIGGLAQIFTLSGIIEEYFAGIWGGTSLIRGLMWRSESLILSRPFEYRAPSWSWASADGPVWFKDYTRNDDYTPTYKLVSISTSAVTDDKFGQIKAGELIVRGFLFEISDFSYMNKVNLNVNRDTAIEKVYFFPMVWAHSHEMSEGLIVQLDGQQTSGEKYQIYTRIGFTQVWNVEGSCTGILREPGKWPCIHWPKEREQVIVIV